MVFLRVHLLVKVYDVVAKAAGKELETRGAALGAPTLVMFAVLGLGDLFGFCVLRLAILLLGGGALC